MNTLLFIQLFTILVVGVSLAVLVYKGMVLISENILSYYKNNIVSPVNQRFEFNWSVYQTISIVSEKMGKRWYEARCHIESSLFVAILTTIGIITIFRTESGSWEKGIYTYGWILGPYSAKRVWKKINSQKYQKVMGDRLKELFGEKWDRYMGVSQLFVAGKNVCFDDINGEYN